MPSRVVLDASAVLALLREEAGEDIVAASLPHVAISAVNLSEIVTRLIDLGHDARRAEHEVGVLSMEVFPFDEAAALRAGALRSSTRKAGLSLGDRACLALAERLDLPVLTTDRAWAGLDLGVEVVLIRQP